MLCAIPFCARDKAQAVRLAEWIARIGGVKAHDCLLVVHKDTDSVGVIEPLTEAFGRIAELVITDDMIVEREQHTYAANLMWKRTVNHIADMNESQPFLWLEVDCTPIPDDGRGNWLDAIAGAYKLFGKPFMHDLVRTPRGRSNSGCGVYPAKVRDYTSRLWELADVSWDILLYEDFARHTAYTTLIQDIGFLADGKTLPTFPDQDSLSIIRPEALLFHRCKDETIIDRLRERENWLESSHGRAPVPSGLDASLEETGGAVRLGASHPSAPAVDPEIERHAWEEWKKREGELLTRIAKLESDLAYANATYHPPKPVAISRGKSKPKASRSPEQQAAIDARMAKVRAGRTKSKA